MRYSLDQFEPGEAWLVFRVDCLVQDQPVDIYLLMDVASTYVFGNIVVPGELPEAKEIRKLMQDAYKTKNSWPKKFFCPEQDPAEDLFRRHSEKEGISFEVAPLSYFERIVGPLKKSFSQHFYSPMASAGGFDHDTPPTDKQRISQAFIPDSYDLCPCASGLKYKFCCKPIFIEITHAMRASEEGHLKEALKWMQKAKSKVGETAEILCRYAIVYTFFDTVKADEYLEKCLLSAPRHPRANYVRGIDLKEKGDIEGAIKAYKTAIENYPSTDRYHRNEAWNNLGTAYYDLGKYSEAKAAWEKAFVYLPEDPVAPENLNTFIYNNPNIPKEIRGSQNIH
jgi:predicted negative regulator of RcsB-dependent stress response